MDSLTKASKFPVLSTEKQKTWRLRKKILYEKLVNTVGLHRMSIFIHILFLEPTILFCSKSCQISHKIQRTNSNIPRSTHLKQSNIGNSWSNIGLSGPNELGFKLGQWVSGANCSQTGTSLNQKRLSRSEDVEYFHDEEMKTILLQYNLSPWSQPYLK